MAVTVDNVTVIITDYKPKKRESHGHAVSSNNNTPADRAIQSPTATSSSSKEHNSSTQSSPDSKSPLNHTSVSPVTDIATPKTVKNEPTDDVKET